MSTIQNWVDGIEQAVFLLLAIIALLRGPAEHAYRWLAMGLLLLTQILFNPWLVAFTPWIDVVPYTIMYFVVMRPLAIIVWIMVWRGWFGLRGNAWLPFVLGGLFVVCAVCSVFGRPWITVQTGAFGSVVTSIRIVLAAIYGWIVLTGLMRTSTANPAITACAAILVSVGLFQPELSAMGVPTGIALGSSYVGRTEIAYALLAPLMYLLIQARSDSREFAVD
jgi:hypothetical protein